MNASRLLLDFPIRLVVIFVIITDYESKVHGTRLVCNNSDSIDSTNSLVYFYRVAS